MTIALSSPLALVRAARYSDPGEPSAILPDVYGDFTVGGIRGPIAPPLIDKATNTYGIATPMQSVTAVYEEELDITADATIVLSTNYQGQGLITTIAFATPRAGQITVRGIGKNVSVNPITQLEDLLAARAGATTTDYVTTMLERARALCATLGFTTAWVIADDQPVQAWIAEFMYNLYGGWTRLGDGRLLLWLEGDAWDPSDCVAHIVAHRHCVQGDDDPRMTMSERDLANALTVRYLYSYSLADASSRLVSPEDALSKNAYGEARKSITLRGHRDAGQIATWSARFFDVAAARHRVEGAILTFAVKGAILLHATEGDLIGFSWSSGPTREAGHRYANEVVRIIGIAHVLDGQPRSEVTALSLGRYLTEDRFYDAEAYYDADVFYGGHRQLAEMV